VTQKREQSIEEKKKGKEEKGKALAPAALHLGRRLSRRGKSPEESTKKKGKTASRGDQPCRPILDSEHLKLRITIRGGTENVGGEKKKEGGKGQVGTIQVAADEHSPRAISHEKKGKGKQAEVPMQGLAPTAFRSMEEFH